MKKTILVLSLLSVFNLYAAAPKVVCEWSSRINTAKSDLNKTLKKYEGKKITAPSITVDTKNDKIYICVSVNQ